MLSIFRSQKAYRIFVYSSLYGTILFAALLAGLIAVDPVTADWIAYEDFIIESMTALGALAASLVVLAVALGFLFKKSYLRGGFGLLMAVAFFVIAMEEISWMQRILEIEPDDFFLENNIQKEINFHNLNTAMTMMIFSIVVFVVFTIVPFLKNVVGRLLDVVRFSQLKIFIPSQWLILVFAIAQGFSMSFAIYPQMYHMIILALTALLLLYFVLIRSPDYIKDRRTILYLTILVILAGMMAVNTNVLGGTDMRAWFPSEYREFFICLGIFLYSIDLVFRAASDGKERGRSRLKGGRKPALV